MEVKIGIDDLEVLHRALKCYIGSTPEWDHNYSIDKARDLSALVYGFIQDYNYAEKTKETT